MASNWLDVGLVARLSTSMKEHQCHHWGPVLSRHLFLPSALDYYRCNSHNGDILTRLPASRGWQLS